MVRAFASALLIVLLLGKSAGAQTPTGTISGVVTDSSGAALREARITITNVETGHIRRTTSSDEGNYTAPALLPAEYRVAAEATGFRRLERITTVEVGSTMIINLELELGEMNDTVTVRGDATRLRYDHHQVGGVVGREQIETVPLNGRNFLDLAKLEPGVTDTVRGTNNRVFVPMLGGGLQTVPRIGHSRVTVDGASIGAVGTIGTLLQVSQDVIEEFQLSTVNFDLPTSMTTIGAINVVTRSGSNEHHGSGFLLYRDDNLAAYPGLRRDESTPDPFFQRRQFGASAGGPVRKDRAFFFGSYERHDQRGVVSVQPIALEFGPLGGIFPTTYHGNLFSARVDVQLNSRHSAFTRFTRDDNRVFGPLGAGAILPSSWSRQVNRIDQVLAALTSVVSDSVINDIRFSAFLVDMPDGPADSEACPGCFGLGMQRITIPDAGIGFGNARTLSFVGSRYQLTETLMWHRGRHRFRFTFDWEHASDTASMLSAEPITLWSPRQVRQQNPTIPLPFSFATPEDVVQLPLQNFEISVGPGGTPQRGFRADRILDLYRVSASDVWRVGSRLSVNAGVAWSYEPNALNHDLTKPPLLIPILGAGGLHAARAQRANFSPALGFAWTTTSDGKTVVRGGVGRYFDPDGSNNSTNLGNERRALLPLGTGRLMVTGSNLPYGGGTLEFRQPTSFTGGQLLAILPAIRADLLRSLNPNNRDFSVRNINITKAGTNLKDPGYHTPSAVHISLGVQRELPGGFVVSADGVWKHFVHTFINGIDYNRWNSVGGAVIPPCTPQQRTDVMAQCSNGSIFFDTTIGRARYKGLLGRVEKRFSRRYQFLASYAFGSYVGTNGTGTATAEMAGGRVFGFNNDDWFENYGPLPTDLRHVLNVSGVVELPWRLQLAFNAAAYSRPPFSVYIANMDFNGDGTTNDLLPGTTVNQFDRGLTRADLERLVNDYNRTYAGRRFGVANMLARQLTMTDDYSFDDNFFSQDLRITRSFRFASWRVRLAVFAEVFNLLNTANLVGFSGNLANPDTFGKPNARFTQVFGSGGPRAFQLGARLSF